MVIIVTSGVGLVGYQGVDIDPDMIVIDVLELRTKDCVDLDAKNMIA